MMTHRWRGVTRDRDKKAHTDQNYVWTKNDSHLPPLSVRSRKLIDVEIVEAEMQLINSVLERIKCRMLTDCAEDVSIAMCENANASA